MSMDEAILRERLAGVQHVGPEILFPIDWQAPIA
jgi:hypothetical protein